MTFFKNIIKKIIPLYYRNIIRFNFSNIISSYIEKDWIKSNDIVPPHIIKQKILKKYKQKYNLSILVETGTYLADMMIAQKNNFKQLYSIELSKYCYNLSVKRCKKYKNIKILFGDSVNLLENIINKINEPILFWLDGHGSGGVTERGEVLSPILKEINIIFKNNPTNFKHIILIDDAIGFNGEDGYPTIEEFKKIIYNLNKNYKIEIKDNIIRCFV